MLWFLYPFTVVLVYTPHTQICTDEGLIPTMHHIHWYSSYSNCSNITHQNIYACHKVATGVQGTPWYAWLSVSGSDSASLQAPQWRSSMGWLLLIVATRCTTLWKGRENGRWWVEWLSDWNSAIESRVRFWAGDLFPLSFFSLWAVLETTP